MSRPTDRPANQVATAASTHSSVNSEAIGTDSPSTAAMPGTASSSAAAPAATVAGTAARHAGSRPARMAVVPIAISATIAIAGASTYSSSLLGTIW